MTFKSGQSGNPNGRPKGAQSKRVQLIKLLEPRSLELIEKAIELALGGDTDMLRFCLDRLIPKANRESMLGLPDFLDAETLSQWKDMIMRSAVNGQISADEAEKLIKLLSSQIKQEINIPSIREMTNDPVEASRIYQQVMMG